MNKTVLFLISISIFATSIEKNHAQIAVGQWRDHFSYNRVSSLADEGNLIYCASELGIFTFDKTSFETEKITKGNGLTENNVILVKYDAADKALFVAYQNSNIDIIKNNKVYNFPDIKRKQIGGSKKINNVVFINNTAYLCCGFGIVLLNMNKLEFNDTWYIGQNAELINVMDFATDGTYFYAAAEKGLFRADKSNPVLSDYHNWNPITEIPNSSNPVNSVCISGQNIYISQRDAAQNTHIIKFNGQNWSAFETSQFAVRSISQNFGKIISTDLYSVKIYKNDILETEIKQYNFPDSAAAPVSINAAYLETSSVLRIADTDFGLITVNIPNMSFEKNYPDGPSTNSADRTAIKNGKVYFTGGGFDASLTAMNNNPQFFIFDGQTTKSYNGPSPAYHDIYSVYPNPYKTDDFFLGSWGQGMFEMQGDKKLKQYDESNSSLQIIGTTLGSCRIASMNFDKNKNLWVTNPAANNPVSVLTNQGNWHSYNFGGVLTKKEAGQILVTSSGNIWIQIFRGGGIFAFNSNNTPDDPTDDKSALFFPVTYSGESITNTVNCLAEDQSGDIWAGTDKGVVVYHSPDNVFSGQNFFADRIQLTALSGDTTEQYLLNTENVVTIAVDGGNRKWIATQNSGVYLESEDGKQEIKHFTVDNSILPSNTINDLAIDPQSGEVFICTEKGMVSYRAEATSGGDAFGNVYVFPNPVRPGYEGAITITGLIQDADVKITDVTGSLVFETTALGGQAVWYGKTLNGRKVNTGVYLVFCANKDGSQTFVSKILFVN
jgi:hypothetical protein